MSGLDDILNECDDKYYIKEAEKLRKKIRGLKAINQKSSHLEKQLIKLTNRRLSQ